MLTGSENTLKALLITDIGDGILAECGQAPSTPNCIAGISAGISNSMVAHIVAVAQVAAGIALTVGPHPLGGTAVGTTTSVGFVI